VQGKMPVGRQKNHEETQHADEVVVVEVGGFVHQLNVGKAEEKYDDGSPVLKSDGDKNSGKPADDKYQIGPLSYRLDPFKTIIREKKIRFDIELVNPTVCSKTNNADEHQNSKKDTKDSQWSRIGCLRKIFFNGSRHC